MNPLREKYVEDIKDSLKFKVLSNRIDANTNDFSFTSKDEAFFAELLNLIFDYNLSKTELIKKNYPAIDLVDDTNKIIIQVTYSINNDKLKQSISHGVIAQYTGYKFIYFYTGDKDISSFKRSIKQIENPYNLSFKRSKNIIAVEDIIFEISNIVDTYRLKKIRSLFPEEHLLESKKISSQLTKVINILKGIKRSFEMSVSYEEDVIAHDIQEKIDYNNLFHYEDTVSRYTSYRALLQADDGIYKISYEEVNITPSEIYSKIKTYYRQAMVSNNPNSRIPRNGDKIFIDVFEAIKNDIRTSTEYAGIEEELLDDCLYIILVDAFVECKWFAKPPNK